MAPRLPIGSATDLATIAAQSVSRSRFFSWTMGAFAVAAVFLSALGVHGLLAFAVAQRRREIGIRMALGAQPVGVFRMVLGEGLKLTTAGVVVGLAGAAAGTRLISRVLFEVPALDPLTFVLVAVLLITTGLFACYVPARRAMRVDPMVALRYE